jgi:GH24 family phage-related lysozyme (muramidase)
MRADRDFNLDIGRDLNVYMPADYATNEEKKFQLDLHAGGGGPPGTPDINFQYSKVSGLKDANPEGKHTVPNGSIVLQVKEGQVHTTIEKDSVYHTMGVGDYHHRLENGSYYRQVVSGMFNGRTASNHFQRVDGRSLFHTKGKAAIVSDSMLSTLGMLGVQHFSGGDMNIKVENNLVGGSGNNMFWSAGKTYAVDYSKIFHNSGVATAPKGVITVDNVFGANRAKEILTQEFEDMVKYDPQKGPETKKVERRLTRYPTMEPYGGLISNPGEGTLYHIDETTTAVFKGITGDPVVQTVTPVDVEEQEIPIGRSTPTNGSKQVTDTISPDIKDASIIPDPVSGQPRPEFSEGQYVGTHYDAQGNPQYKKVDNAVSTPASKADCSGKGVDLIKSHDQLTQTVQKTEAGEMFVGYGHVLNTEKQQQVSAAEVTAQAKELLLRSTEDLPPFGKALLGTEVLSWASKTGNKLLGVTRGLDGTTAQAHAKSSMFTFPGESYSNGITRQQADALFDNDIKKSVTAVRKSVKANINQNQADALISLARNLGTTAFIGSTVVSAINSKNFAKAITEFMRYNKVTKNILAYENGTLSKTPTTVIDSGLTRRRAQEAKLFSSPPTAKLRNTVNNASGYHPSGEFSGLGMTPGITDYL